MSAALQQAFGLGGKTALITGGGTGIGLAIARSMAAAGADVILAGRRSDVLRKAAQDIGAQASVCVMDLSRPESLEADVASLIERHGRIDVLVNNAGNTIKKPFEESTLKEFDSILDVHLRGAVELTRHVIKAQLSQGGGNVIFLASMTSFIGEPYVLGYTASKSAITGVVRGLSAEFAERGIRVNAIAPGWIDTELYRAAMAADPVSEQKILGRIQMRRVGSPSDIGWACVYLASNAGSYVTGQTLVIDGGALVGL